VIGLPLRGDRFRAILNYAGSRHADQIAKAECSFITPPPAEQ
jgi:hypothetical protein